MYKYILPISIAAVAFAPALTHAASNTSNTMSEAMGVRPARVTEPGAPLSLQNALRLAFGANAELSSARQEVEAVDASIQQAGIRPNPDVSLLMEDTRRETRTTTWQFNQMIELGGKRSARIDVATRARDAATADLDTQYADIRAAVIIAFFDVLHAQERLLLADTSIDLAHRGALIAARRVTAGKVSPVEETKARVAEATIRLARNQANSELTNARKRLAATWGNAVPRFDRADGQLEALPVLPIWTELTVRLRHAPAIVRARLEVDRRGALARLEHSRRTPDVTVSIGVKRSEELGRNQAIVGLSMPFPLFDRNQGNVTESLRRTDKARDELAAIAIRIDTEVAQAYERLQTARQEADVLQREILPGAQSAYDAATKGFEFGKFEFLSVLDAQRTLLEVKSLYLRSLSDAHRAAAEIDRLLGAPLAMTKQ